MPHTVEVNTPLEALLVEQALLMARELQQVADRAPDGQVLEHTEAAALAAGRELMRQALETALQTQADAAEKKKRRAAPAPAGGSATSKARCRKSR
jgi:hypothetical protein